MCSTKKRASRTRMRRTNLPAYHGPGGSGSLAAGCDTEATAAACDAEATGLRTQELLADIALAESTGGVNTGDKPEEEKTFHSPGHRNFSS